MFHIFVLSFLVSLCSIVQAQSPGTSDIKVLAKDSSTIVIGSVQEAVWVVNHEKMMNATRPATSGEFRLADPNEFVIGRMYRLRVSEVIKANDPIKRDKKMTPGDVINIFARGRAGSEGSAGFAVKEKYLVLLLPLEASDQVFTGAMLYRPGASFSQVSRFNPAQCYRVVGNESGAIELTQKNGKIIDEVKSIMNKQR